MTVLCSSTDLLVHPSSTIEIPLALAFLNRTARAFVRLLKLSGRNYINNFFYKARRHKEYVPIYICIYSPRSSTTYYYELNTSSKTEHIWSKMSTFPKATRFTTTKPQYSSLPRTPFSPQVDSAKGSSPSSVPVTPQETPLSLNDLQFEAGHTPHPRKATPPQYVSSLLPFSFSFIFFWFFNFSYVYFI